MYTHTSSLPVPRLAALQGEWPRNAQSSASIRLTRAVHAPALCATKIVVVVKYMNPVATLTQQPQVSLSPPDADSLPPILPALSLPPGRWGTCRRGGPQPGTSGRCAGTCMCLGTCTPLRCRSSTPSVRMAAAFWSTCNRDP